MSEQHRGAWGDAMWWPGVVAAPEQQLHQQHLLQPSQQHDSAGVMPQTTHQQLFSYKMANSFPSPTPVSTAVSTASRAPYDYRMGGSNTSVAAIPTSTPSQTQWWYPPATMDNAMQHAIQQQQQQQNLQQTQQNLQQQQTQQQQQNMPPVQTPPSPQSESQSDTTQRQQQQQEVQQRHQEAQQRHQQEVQQRHQQEVQRQQAEAIHQHHQAIAEAQARHQQLQQQHQQLQQQQLQQQQQQLQQQHLQKQQQQQQQLQQQLQNNHHQQLQQVTPILGQNHNRGRMPRAKADARPRGRMTAYAFFVQTCREEHKKKHPEENVVFAEFSKKCAERWKTMLDKEKKRFHEMAENDKKRYDDEMKNYTPPKGEKQRGKKRKQIKDPNAPKRSLSAFFWFSNDERAKVKSENPEFGVGDIAKELGRRWADAEPEIKSKYEALADKDKARYEKEMTAYKKRNNPSMQQQNAQALSVPENEDGDDDDEEAEDEEDE